MQKKSCSILFSCRVDLCQNQFICFLKRLREFIEERDRSRIGMRLENAPELVVRHIFGSAQGRLDLCWVMRIVIDDLHAFGGRADDVETALRAMIALEGLLGQLRLYAKAQAQVNAASALRILCSPGTASCTRLSSFPS